MVLLVLGIIVAANGSLVFPLPKLKVWISQPLNRHLSITQATVQFSFFFFYHGGPQSLKKSKPGAERAGVTVHVPI